jgi:hypothetical protein
LEILFEYANAGYESLSPLWSFPVIRLVIKNLLTCCLNDEETPDIEFVLEILCDLGESGIFLGESTVLLGESIDRLGDSGTPFTGDRGGGDGGSS